MSQICFVKGSLAMIVALLAGTGVANRSVAAEQVEVQEKFLGSGVTQKVGGYRPISAKLSDEAEGIEQQPEELVNPRYGKLKFGDKEYSILLDEPQPPATDDADDEGEAEGAEPGAEDAKGDAAETSTAGKDADPDQQAEPGTPVEPRLFVDANADGDLTNDPAIDWKATPSGPYKLYRGSAEIDLGDGRMAAVDLYRFDPTDPRRKSLADIVFYYGDFGYELEFQLDDKPFSTFVAGALSDNGRLPIDRDDNGKISRNFETVQIGQPFNFTGTSYEFKVEDGQLHLQTSDEELEQLPMPPDLRIGQPALEFTATTLDGTEVNFPGDYAGKLVMLDFWATWCGPCIGEIPNMKTAYADWHDKGFEILGISFDQPNKEDVLKEFLEERELPWAQVYEGKGWDTSIGNQHDVSGIPFVLLVDGDTGKIMATARELRGPGLSKFIGEALGEEVQEDNGEKETAEDEPAADDE